MTTRSALLGVTAMLLPLAGCGAGEAAAPAAATTPDKSFDAVVEPKIDNPRAAAQTPCSDAVRSQVQAVLGLDSVPTPESAWADNRYTCTYQTPQGPLVYAVTVESTQAAAADYFETLRGQLRANSSLTGLEHAYQNGLGTVIALVDSLVLSVDVSALPAEHLGPDHQTETGVAIILASGVVIGWAGQD